MLLFGVAAPNSFVFFNIYIFFKLIEEIKTAQYDSNSI